MKKLMFLAFASLFLMACGGGGGSSSSSSGFAPTDQAAFNTKFVGQSFTTSAASTVSILSGNRYNLVQGSTTQVGGYTYTNTGANTANTTLTIDGSTVTCLLTISFTSSLNGNISQVCTNGFTSDNSFTFSGSN